MSDTEKSDRFEDQLEKLEAIVARLEDESVGLEEALELFERGMELARGCRARLESAVGMLPYFSRLQAYTVDVSYEDGPPDVEYEVLCAYPDSAPEEIGPTGEETDLLGTIQETDGVGTTGVHRGPDGAVILSFLSPLEEREGGERSGVLVGRVEIGVNLALDRVLTGLQSTMDRGEGLVVNEDGRIVAHPDPDRLLEEWETDETRPPLRSTEDNRGWVRESRDPETNARQLACYVPVEGHTWAVVILLPFEVVLGLLPPSPLHSSLS